MSLIKKKNSFKMKKYNDIGDLYREMFSDYTPNPPASVWEGVKSAMQKKPIWKKWTLPFAGTVLVGAVVYLFMINPHPKESAITVASDKQKNTENQIVENQSTSNEESFYVLNEQNMPASQRESQGNVLATQNSESISIAMVNFSNDNAADENLAVVTEQVSDKKTSSAVVANASDAQNREQNPVKTAENPLPKTLPAKISKDTTVCENAAVQLYAYNAENIRWSTGETKNIITVYPSYREQYSVTFSTTNARDTTVYIHINVVKCAEVFIPTAFTPNGDNLNDVFLAKTDMELKSFEMIIYSANGQVLFISKDINRGWDGTYKGQPQPHGLYYYTVRYTDNFGKHIEKPGELLLILQ